MKRGFTLVEIIVYIGITVALLVVIASLVMNIFNARQQITASETVQHDARFIYNYIASNMHNVTTIEDISPDPAQFYFYQGDAQRFTLTIDNGDLVYRVVSDDGSGFPDIATAQPVVLNSDRVAVSDFTMISYTDDQGVSGAGVKVTFTLTTGTIENPFRRKVNTYSTFFAVR